MRKLLYASLFVNLLLLSVFAYWINHRGGWRYIKQTFGIEKKMEPSSYYSIKSSIFETLPLDSSDIVFIGNSLTDYGHWDELFPELKIKNRGIGGDDILGVQSRIDVVLHAQPKKLFLLIGTNDLEYYHDKNLTVERYEQLVAKIKQDAPNTKLYLLSILPTRGILNRPNKHIVEMNEDIRLISKKFEVTYIDLHSQYKDEKGELKQDFTLDGIHINGKGYERWKDVLLPYLME